MERITESDRYICPSCRRALSAEAFYVNPHTLKRDCYCRECRKLRNARCTGSFQRVNTRPSWPLIVNEPDRERRLSLIRHARQVVRERVERKRRLLVDEETS